MRVGREVGGGIKRKLGREDRLEEVEGSDSVEEVVVRRRSRRGDWLVKVGVFGRAETSLE